MTRDLVTASTAPLVTSAAPLPTAAALSLMSRLLAAASSPRSSILRFAPSKESRKFVALWSKKRPMVSISPGVSLGAGDGCAGAASWAAAAGASMSAAASAAVRHVRIRLSVPKPRIGFNQASRPRLPQELPWEPPRRFYHRHYYTGLQVRECRMAMAKLRSLGSLRTKV